ncbi:hypothetical protein RHS01_08366 [Rhizoctonia solani]|uniref:Uncharacterized protein n=1 Tax=Rhizoctonia solani TaxID=456999 RepID=A0A8H7M1Y5_9AGAM|nr:hypothetical protein RHS01_08366 [Rhizoctonia solani]
MGCNSSKPYGDKHAGAPHKGRKHGSKGCTHNGPSSAWFSGGGDCSGGGGGNGGGNGGGGMAAEVEAEVEVGAEAGDAE